jgi:hypothetical protein
VLGRLPNGLAPQDADRRSSTDAPPEPFSAPQPKPRDWPARPAAFERRPALDRPPTARADAVDRRPAIQRAAIESQPALDQAVVAERPAPSSEAPMAMTAASVGEAAPPAVALEAPVMDRVGSTGPQLRRFIKSRAYVPMHELRRRFGINGNDDDVTPIELDARRIFVGLPVPEGRLLGELLRAGDIGYELSMDPISPIVVGVYPMRPVPRP